MSDWTELVGELGERGDLTTPQVQALVEVLALVLYADNRCSALEEREFLQSLLATETLGAFEHIISAQLNVSAAPSRHAHEQSRRDIARRACGKLDGSTLRRPIFVIAKSLMESHEKLGRPHCNVIELLADEFEFTDETPRRAANQ